MSFATDGEDRNGLQLEKIGPFFFQVLSVCLGKIVQNLTWFVLPLRKSCDFLLLVFQENFVWEKGFSFNFSTV